MPGIGPAILYIGLLAYLGDLAEARLYFGTKMNHSPVCYSDGSAAGAVDPAYGACPTACSFLHPTDHPTAVAAADGSAAAGDHGDDATAAAAFVQGVPAPALFSRQYQMICGTDVPCTLYPAEYLHVRYSELRCVL